MGSLLPFVFRKNHQSQWLHAKLLALLCMMLLFATGFTLWTAFVRFTESPLYTNNQGTFQKFMPQGTRTYMTASIIGGYVSYRSKSMWWNNGNRTTATATATVTVTAIPPVHNGNEETETPSEKNEQLEQQSSCKLSLFSSGIPMADRCRYVQTHDGCQQNIFLQLLYCTLNHPAVMWIWFVFCGVTLLYFFYLLGDTADSYFSPSLFTLSEYLKLSPNVAGVTLLALGNGAPDLSAIMVSVFRGSADVGVGAPIGSGMFVSCFVLGCVALVSSVKVTRRPFLRDVVFFILSVLFVFYLYVDRKIEIWESIICLLFYFAYVTVVVVGRAIFQKVKRRKLERKEQLLQEEAERKHVAKEQRALEKKRKKEEKLANKDKTSTNEDKVGEAGDDDFGRVIDDDDDYDHASTNSDESDSEDEEATTSGWRRQPTFIKFDREAAGEEKEEEETMEQKLRRYESAVFIPRFGIISRPNRRESKHQDALVIRNYFDENEQKEEQVRRLLERQDTMALVLNNGENIDTSDIDVDYVNSSMKDGDAYSEMMEEDEFEYEYGRKKKHVQKLFTTILQSVGWYERAWYSKITLVLFEGVSTFMRNITVPKGQKSDWNKWFTACVPIFSPLLFMFALGQFEYLGYMIGGVFPLALIPVIIGSLFSVAIIFTSKGHRAPIYYPIFVFYAFVMSIVWIFTVADYLVSLLEAVGVALGINPSVLALTFLAWGNSIGDLAADVSIARQGFPSMAVGACFGGPFLSLMLGLGLSMTIKILLLPADPTGIAFRCTALDPEPAVMVLILCLLVTLIATIIVVPVFKFRVPKPYGIVLILAYSVAVMLALLSAMWDGFGTWFTWPIGRGCRSSVF